MHSLQHCLIVWRRLSSRLSTTEGCQRLRLGRQTFVSAFISPMSGNFQCGHSEPHAEAQKVESVEIVSLLCIFQFYLFVKVIFTYMCVYFTYRVLQCANLCTRWHYGTYYSVPIDNFHFGWWVCAADTSDDHKLLVFPELMLSRRTPSPFY